MEKKSVNGGRNGGPPPVISAEDRARAQAAIAAAPRGQKLAVLARLAAELGVHPNTLRYTPKRATPTTDYRVGVLRAQGLDWPEIEARIGSRVPAVRRQEVDLLLASEGRRG